jgi:hypothetical protein
MLFWAAVALVNMTAGVVLAADPRRASDFETVRRWTAAWLFQGRDLYAPALSGTDYPPHAILALSPISLLPDPAAVPAWAALNLLLALVAPFVASRIVRRDVRVTDAACVAVFFLAWSGTKTLLQFTLLTLVFGLLAVAHAERRPRWSGVWLALSLMKPQVGAPFLLWLLFARRWKVAAVALVTVAGASLAWCARAGANPLHVAVRYLQILRVYYTGERGMVGVAQIDPLIGLVLPQGAGSMVAALIPLSLLAIVCIEGRRARHCANQGSTGGSCLPAAMAAAWSLLTFYGLTYGLVLLLPAAAMLLLDQVEATRPGRQLLFWVMQVGLTVDVPGLWRRLVWGMPAPEAAGELVPHYYRVLVMVLFLGFWLLVRREARTPRAAGTFSPTDMP